LKATHIHTHRRKNFRKRTHTSGDDGIRHLLEAVLLSRNNKGKDKRNREEEIPKKKRRNQSEKQNKK